jgi:hypothetical protein
MMYKAMRGMGILATAGSRRAPVEKCICRMGPDVSAAMVKPIRGIYSLDLLSSGKYTFRPAPVGFLRWPGGRRVVQRSILSCGMRGVSTNPQS